MKAEHKFDNGRGLGAIEVLHTLYGQALETANESSNSCATDCPRRSKD